MDDIECRIGLIDEEIIEINRSIKNYKSDFRKEIKTSNGYRSFRSEQIKESNIISVFESTLTRTLNMNTNELYDSMIVIRVYYYEILKDIMLNGFMLNGEKYVIFTASAGQIRTKKVVFLKESLWMSVRDQIMCGLSPEIIEAKGGTNRNKYLAYLALCNSATDEWKRFDIRKSIVVDDFETLVVGDVDYIDEKTFEITRKELGVPITHTDGCGMILPSVSSKNFMIRMPWIKGLLASFPFDQFIREEDSKDPTINHGLVRDIYGVQHDVLKEGIEVIFTKSQFKMWKFYDSWAEYVEKFIDYGCTAGKCNEEENFIPKAKLNYQVIQTLNDMSDDEVSDISRKTIKKILNIATSRYSKLEAFGATKDNMRRNAFQNCLLIYPELLSTPYAIDTLRMIKDSLIKEARSGKLDIDGKYLFIIPDLYAFCQFLFTGNENPRGLLDDGEVYCKQYSNTDTLDCLRSPHLGREHAVRKNVIDPIKSRWFTTDGIYTSCHDLISKFLMFDVDGDKSLVVADSTFVSIAKRNMNGIVPPYYHMGKAGTTSLSNKSLYDGMILAYTGGKIGINSNDITKIWNGSDEPDYDAIKILCAMTNYTIDFAKTLYKPTIPKSIDKRIKQLTKCKTPYFFIYAKDKTDAQVETLNNSVVNRICASIPNVRIKNSESCKSKFDYTKLMHTADMIESDDIVSEYEQLYKEHSRSFSGTNENAPLNYVKLDSIKRLSKIAGSPVQACDMLVHYLFKTKKSKRQRLFWLCFADIVLGNLEANLAGTMYCANCGARVKRESNNQKLCPDCSESLKHRDKEVICEDCGKSFMVPSKSKNKIRCDECQAIKNLERHRKHNQKRK